MLATLGSRLGQLAEGSWLTRRWAISRAGVLLAVQAALLLFFIAGTHGWIVKLRGHTTTDFVSFYAAGALADAGTPTLAYDQPAHYAAEQAATAPGVNYEFFFYPPVFLLLCSPLAWLPYMAAFLLFDVVTLGLFLAVIRGILRPRGWGWLVPALAFPAVPWVLGLGQNSFLTAALLGFGTLWVDRRPVLAGLVLGALCFKPHFGLLLPVALAAGGHWRTFAGAAASVAGLALAATLLYGVEIWPAYLAVSTTLHHAYAAQIPTRFPGLVTFYGAGRLLGLADTPAMVLQAAAAVAAGLAVAWVWRRGCSLPVRAAALTAGAIVALPIALFYDLMVAMVAMAWLVRAGWESGFRPWEKTVLATVFLIPFYSMPVAETLSLPVGALAAPLLLGLCLRRAREEGAASATPLPPGTNRRAGFAGAERHAAAGTG